MLVRFAPRFVVKLSSTSRKGMGPPEVMLQAVAPARRHRRVFKQRGEEAEVAEGHAEFGEARGFQGADRQFQDAGFGRRRIGGGKPFKAGLEEFLRAQVLIGKTEGGAEIAIVRFLVGLFRVAQVIAAGGHREVGPQAHFGAGGIGEHKGPGTDILAGTLEENIGGLDDVGGDVVKAGALKHRHDGGVLPFQRLALGFRFTGHLSSENVSRRKRIRAFNAPCRVGHFRGIRTRASFAPSIFLRRTISSGTETCARRWLAYSSRDSTPLASCAAEGQILQRHFALGLFIAALNDNERAAALVGIFHLGLHAGGADIHFGADICGAQLLHHFLVIALAFLIHDENDNGSSRFLVLSFAQKFQRGIKPRHADGKSGGRNRLPGKARHQIIIAPSATNGTKTNKVFSFRLLTPLGVRIRKRGQCNTRDHGQLMNSIFMRCNPRIPTELNIA